MENKINVAELLKNCPTGMELDCLTFDNVFFQELDWSTVFPIICYRINNGIKENMHLTEFGSHFSDNDAKCIIFPKGKTTWEGFVPPCQLEDGKIVATNNGLFIGIIKVKNNRQVGAYCSIDYSEDFRINSDYWFERLATEEEKAKLFQAIKDNGYVWNEETKALEKLPKIKVSDRVKKKSIDDVDAVEIAKIIQSMHTFTNKFDITTLKPFQKVLVRDSYSYSDKEYWSINLFGFYNEITKQFHCMGNSNIGWNECIPYEGNEHLLGTTNDCDEFYKTWK